MFTVANLNKNVISNLTLAEAQEASKVTGLNAMQKQLIATRIKKVSAPPTPTQPISDVQAQVGIESTTGAPDQPSQEKAPDQPSQEKAPEGELKAPDQPSQEKAPEIPPVIIAPVAKGKPGETTFTIPAFKDDTKGIRAGTKDNPLARVTYTEKGTGKILQGTVQRIFQFFDEVKYKHKGGVRQEAKILGDDTKRLYRFEEEINLVEALPIEPTQPTEPETPIIPEATDGGAI